MEFIRFLSTHYHLNILDCHTTKFPSHLFWCVLPKVYCLRGLEFGIIGQCTRVENAWYFLNIKLHSFWKGSSCINSKKSTKTCITLSIVTVSGYFVACVVYSQEIQQKCFVIFCKTTQRHFLLAVFFLWNLLCAFISS